MSCDIQQYSTANAAGNAGKSKNPFNEKRIKRSLGAMSPLEYRRSIGWTAVQNRSYIGEYRFLLRY